MSERLSLPKDKIRVLLLEGISESASDILIREGYHTIERIPKALEGAALQAALRGVHILGIRSRTQLDAAAIASAHRLSSVGCFCIGTNQVDLITARAHGIPVFNAPFSNTRSVAELVMGEIVMLMRGIVPRSASAHLGGWDKSAEGSHEVRGKTLGIVGYGNIGSQLSVLAEAFGMRVMYYDQSNKLQHGNAAVADSLGALLAASDVVTLHVPETPETEGMIGAAEIAAMRPGAFLINNARGRIVDLDALAAALRERRLHGAAIDVFPSEPSRNGEAFVSPLQGLPNVILTPHVGGSTEEAQERIGAEVARKLIDWSDTGSTAGAVNFPQAQLPPRLTGARYMNVHRNEPGVMRRINDVFARRGVNIAAQILQTDGDLGYVLIEADGSEAGSREVLRDLRALEGTVRARLIYGKTADPAADREH